MDDHSPQWSSLQFLLLAAASATTTPSTSITITNTTTTTNYQYDYHDDWLQLVASVLTTTR